MAKFPNPNVLVTDANPGDVVVPYQWNGQSIGPMPFTTLSNTGHTVEIVATYPFVYWDDLDNPTARPPSGQSMVVQADTMTFIDQGGLLSNPVSVDMTVTASVSSFTTQPSISAGLRVFGAQMVLEQPGQITVNPGQIDGGAVPSPAFDLIDMAGGLLQTSATATFTVNEIPALDDQLVAVRVRSGGLSSTTPPFRLVYAAPVVAVGLVQPVPLGSVDTDSPDYIVDTAAMFTGKFSLIETRNVPAFVQTSGEDLRIFPPSTALSYTAEFRAVSSGGSSDWVTGSGQINAVVVPLAATSAPVISGTPNPGQSLSLLTPGGYNKPATKTYQWVRRLTANPGDPLSDIGGALGTTNPIVGGDVGWTWTIEETADDGVSPPVVQIANLVDIVAAPVSGTVTLTKDAVSFDLNDVDLWGSFFDGSLWCRMAGTGLPNCLRMQPDGGIIARYAGTTLIGSFQSNGAMWKPGNAKEIFPASATDTLAQRQALNYGVSLTTSARRQGFDALTGSPSYFYNDPYNVDPVKTGQPVTLKNGTLVKAVSHITDAAANARPAVKYYATLTVYPPGATPPTSDNYRPGLSEDDVTVVRALRSQKGPVSDRPRKSVITSQPRIAFSKAINILSTVQPVLSAIDTNSRNVTAQGPSGQHYRYPGDNWEMMEVLLEQMTDRWTDAEWLQIDDLIITYYQNAASRVNQGWVNVANGGNAPGWVWGFLYCLWRLPGNAFFRAALDAMTVGNVPSANYGAMTTLDLPVSGDLSMHYLVTQAHISTPPYPFAAHTQDQLGQGDWNDATDTAFNGTIAGPNNRMAFVEYLIGRKGSYRSIHQMGAAGGRLMAAMGGMDALLPAHAAPALSSIDLYMQERLRLGRPLPTALNGNDPVQNGIKWLGDAWTQQRGSTNLVVLPSWDNPVGPLTLINSQPTNGSTGQISASDHFAMNFSHPVKEGTSGAITIWEEVTLNSDVWTLVESFDMPADMTSVYITAGRVLFSGRAVLGNPVANLVPGRRYELRVDPGAIVSIGTPTISYAGHGTGVCRFTA